MSLLWVVIVAILLTSLVGLEFANLLVYRKILKQIDLSARVKKDWAVLADGHTGNIDFERLWLRLAQNEFVRILLDDDEKA